MKKIYSFTLAALGFSFLCGANFVDDVEIYEEGLMLNEIEATWDVADEVDQVSIFEESTSEIVQVYSSELLEEMTVYNELGAEVYTCSINESQNLNFSELDPGEYTVHTTIGAENRTYKLLKG